MLPKGGKKERKKETGHCKFDQVEYYWEVFCSDVEGYKITKTRKMLNRRDESGQSCLVFDLAGGNYIGLLRVIIKMYLTFY